MPDGYRGSALPSPWRGAGTGLGALLASFLTKPMREREEQEEQIREAWEQAKLTGDKTQLGKLREQYPKAVKRFEEERGLELPGMPTPEVAGGTMELPRAAGPALEPGMAPLPSARPMPGAPVEPSRMPGAAVTMPGTETAEMPWPTTQAGVGARALQEQLRGQELPAGLQPPAPKPTDVISDAVRTAMDAPEGERQKVYEVFRKAHPDLPELMFKDKPPKPLTPSEMMAAERNWPDMDDTERALARERGILPDRPPTTKPEAEKGPPQPTFAQALKIGELTGESPPEILSKAAVGEYDYQPYLEAAAGRREVTELIMLIQRQRSIMTSYPTKKRKAPRAELARLTKELADKLGFAYETKEDKSFIDKIIDRLVGEAPASGFDKAIEDWK